jgi:hypothetical protein
MGVRRREEQIKELNTALGSFKVSLGGEPAPQQEPCWFCGADVAPGEGATLVVEPFGAGDPMRGVCHVACAERARGALSADRLARDELEP